MFFVDRPSFCSLLLRPEYNDFRHLLEESFNSNKLTSDEEEWFNSDKLTNDDGINAALEVLHEKNWRGCGPSASGGDIQMTDVGGKSPDIMETLMENAIEEFGLAPRDVYRGIFDLPDINPEHDAAVEQADYLELAKFITKFPHHISLNTLSHKLIAVEPIFDRARLRVKSWEIDFRSPRILEKVMDSSQFKEDAQVWEFYNSILRSSAASVMAGHLFEQIVHRIFAHDRKDSILKSQPTCMVSDGKNPPTFSAGPSPTPTPTPASVSLPPQLSTGAMDTVVVDFKSEDLNVTLEENKYYKPKAENDALFDSFVLRRGPQNAITISVFQITISQTHGGSDKGLENIRKIMARIKKLDDSKADVKVEYFLVCPDNKPHRWTMPAVWKLTIAQNNHQGDVFCMRVHVPGMSCSLPILRPS